MEPANDFNAMTLLLNKHHIFVRGFAVVFLILVGVSLGAGIVEAATTPAPAPAGKGTKALIAGQALAKVGDVAVTGLTIYALLYVAQAIGSGLIVIAGYVLDNAFYWNTQLNPSSMPVVLEGWRIARDLANALFILVILWIAFTIIFDIETLGGKRLLIRVIIVALLINFSLAMVSAVFGLTNEIARPFRDKISPASDAGAFYISSIILNNLKLQNTVKSINKGELDQFKQRIDQQTAVTALPEGINRGPGRFLAYFGAAKEAQATDPVSAIQTACGLGTLGYFIPVVGTAIGIGSTVCVGGTMIYEWARSLAPGASAPEGILETTFLHVLNLAIGALFLFVTAFALFVAGVTLLARLVAMIFLSILAPLAFLLHLVPKFGDRYWSMWINALFRWAFYAPAFYFLMYFSLYTLQMMSTGQPSFTASTQNLPQLLVIITFLALLFGTIVLGRKMGITVADTIINWGQKAGWGALGYAGGLATSGLRRAGLAAVRGAAPPEGAVHRILRGAARFPGARLITKPVAGAYLTQLQQQQKDVREQASKFAILRKDDKLAAFRRAITAKEIAGASLALGPDVKDLANAEFDRALRIAGQFGLQDDILKIRPDKSPDDATRERILKLIKPSDMPNLAEEALTPQVLEFMWKTQGPAYLRQLAQSDKDKLTEKYMSWIRSNPENIHNIQPEMYRFLEGTTARGFGLYLPAGHRAPEAIVRERREEQTETQRREREQQTARREQRAITIQELLAAKRSEALALGQRERELRRAVLTAPTIDDARRLRANLDDLERQRRIISQEIRRLETRLAGRGVTGP